MSYIKCPICELNYMKDNEEMCEQCRKKDIVISINTATKLDNSQLGGQRFDLDLEGFGDYLIARKYGTYSKKGNMTTVIAYVSGIVKIAEIEAVSFDELFANIDTYAKLYGLTGKKRQLGGYQNGTWRNALNRLQDFKDYVDHYMK